MLNSIPYELEALWSLCKAWCEPTEKFSGHVHWQNDCQGGKCDDHQQDYHVSLEGQVVDSIHATFLLYFFVTETQTHYNQKENS